MFESKRGFTLIELMVVVVILAILAVVAVFAYSNYMRRARTQEAMAFLGDIRIKQAQFYASYGRFVSTDTAGPSNYSDSAGYWPPDITPGAPQQWMPSGQDCNNAAPDTPLGRFCLLGVRPSNEIYFQYKTVGWNPHAPGFSGDPPADTIPITAWQDAGRPPWWYAVARTKWSSDPRDSAYVYVMVSVVLPEAIVKDAYAPDFAQ